jgi:winged helix-turn-helix protein
VAEWLSAQVAGGYVTYDAETERFTLPPAQAFVLLDADLPGAFLLGVDRVADGLAALGDADMAARARTLGMGR